LDKQAIIDAYLKTNEYYHKFIRGTFTTYRLGNKRLSINNHRKTIEVKEGEQNKKRYTTTVSSCPDAIEEEIEDKTRKRTKTTYIHEEDQKNKEKTKKKQADCLKCIYFQPKQNSSLFIGYCSLRKGYLQDIMLSHIREHGCEGFQPKTQAKIRPEHIVKIQRLERPLVGWCDECCTDHKRKVTLYYKAVTYRGDVLLLCEDCAQKIIKIMRKRDEE